MTNFIGTPPRAVSCCAPRGAAAGIAGTDLEGSMTDPGESLGRAAVAASADTMPILAADPKAVQYLTVEIKVAGGKPIDERA